MEEERATRLTKMGSNKLLGNLDGGFDSWKKACKETDSVHRIDAKLLKKSANWQKQSS